MELSTAFAVIQFADQCLKYGEKLVRRVQNYRHAEEEARELTITIEINWMKTEAQISFLKKISSDLDPRYSDVQSRVLSELEGKLKTATLTMDQLIAKRKDKEKEMEKERGPEFPALVKALEKMAPRKKLKYAFKKDSLEKIINDLENWQKRFDPSWMLIMRMADSKIDQQLSQEEQKPARRRAGFIMAAKGVRDAARESAFISTETLVPAQAECSIFKPATVLCRDVTERRVPFSDVRLGTMAETKEPVLMDVMVCNPIADVRRTERDVRKLARILAKVDPSTFGLLVCCGVVKLSSSSLVSSLTTVVSGQDFLPAFKFLFAIPPALKLPKSLRTLLIEGNTSCPLNRRLDLAKQLTNSVLFIHSSQFVHKNIRPETIIVFEDEENKTSTSFLVGFEKFRLAEGMTYRTSDGIWGKDLYRHPSRQGTQPEEDYIMQHDIYSLGVVLLELGLWQSFITYPPVSSLSDSTKGLPEALEAGSYDPATAIPPPFISSLSTQKDVRKRAGAIKSSLVSLARTLLPAKVGTKYTDVVLLCLQCLDSPPADEEQDEKDGGRAAAGEFDDVDEDGIVVGVRYIERILLKMQEISI